ncbi:MAG: hypothetical protein IT373_26975 [Polyangiaceae bacterium]|nr:hypothetical protein [Polyangiaceae bacterium]
MIDLDEHLPAIATGDADAFARWLAGAEGRLRASLASFAAEVDVEAVLQESLLRVWNTAPRLVPDGRPNALVRFAVRVARNAAVSEWRRLAAGRVVPEVALGGGEPGDPGDPAAAERALEAGPADPWLRERIRRCHGELGGSPARALGARLGSGGLEHDRELAAGVGMTLNTFLQNVARARKLLAACLERAGVRLAEVWS